MANQYLHPDVYDNGLVTLSENSNMSIVLTAEAPSSRQEAVDLLGTGSGKRISTVISLPSASVTLGNISGGRRAQIGSSVGNAAVTTTGSENIFVAIYDNSRLLVITEESSNQQMTEGNPITIPIFNVNISVQQP